MEITLVQPRHIGSTRIAVAATRAAMSVAALAVIAVVAPGIYSGSAALQNFHRETRIGQNLQGQMLAGVRDRQLVILSEADRHEGSQRAEFVQKAISDAKNELRGHQQFRRSMKSQFDRQNTFLHRITGNKLLEIARAQVQEQEMLAECVKQHLARLERLQRVS